MTILKPFLGVGTMTFRKELAIFMKPVATKRINIIIVSASKHKLVTRQTLHLVNSRGRTSCDLSANRVAIPVLSWRV